MHLLKSLASRLPLRYQQELKRLHFGRQIRSGRFTATEGNEPEYARLGEWVRAGDWVVDVGANVGHYTGRLSDLVGPSGRVIAVEPVPESFELLAANIARFRHRNVTLLNVAASDAARLQGMEMPTLTSGLANRYMAHLTDAPAGLSVLCMPVDALGIPGRVSLIKVDVEGHELPALRGMRRLLERDRPVLIVEGRAPDVTALLAGHGYRCDESPGSPNRVFTPAAGPAA
jgi:FkbM family methyltransferase